MDYLLGQVLQFAGNFAPKQFMMCNGQQLAIQSNAALFSILGTTYGGNGQTTFALPDLRGRTIIGWGQGPGLSNYVLGQKSGVETVTLTIPNMPAHNHVITLQCDGENASEASPEGHYMGTSATQQYSASQASTMAPQNNAASVVGSSLPFSVLNPYLCLSQCICTSGIFPSRN